MKKLMIFSLLLGMSISMTGQVKTKGFAVFEPNGNFKPYEFERHEMGDDEIEIKILYAGICHSDLHNVASDWGMNEYPMVPGHEILGQVVRVGKNVTKFRVGDYAGIGCLVNSCRECDWCRQGLEQFCEKKVSTYHGHDPYHGGEATQGGYSSNYVVSADFAIKVPAGARLERVAPLLCAGVTTWSPIQFARVRRGDKVGVAGFGGLGHMAVKYCLSLGADVTVFDITEDKRADALKMGAKTYVNVNNPDEMNAHANEFDFILSTIPQNYDMAAYLKMVKYGGNFGIVGIPATRNMPSLRLMDIVFSPHRDVFGSLIGGIPETQEMLDYSVAHDIYPDVEIIRPDGAEIDKAYKNVLDGKVKFRYVIDMRNFK